MPNIIHNPQFLEIEKRIGTIITVPQKIQIKIWEYPEIVQIMRTETENRNLTIQEWFRWINYKQLSSLGKLGIEIEKKIPQYVTASDLGMTEEKFNIAYRKAQFYRNKGKLFGEEKT